MKTSRQRLVDFLSARPNAMSLEIARALQLSQADVRHHLSSELDEYLKSGYGIFAGKKVAWAALKFTPLAARWVAAQTWHSKQKARFEDGGIATCSRSPTRTTAN